MNNLEIVILDSATLGDDVTFSMLERLGNLTVYEKTVPDEVEARIKNADVVIVNKICLTESNLCTADKLRLVCVTATGYDNVDVAYCKKRGIGVCNVTGYSSDSVAQVTAAMALSLFNNLSEFDSYVKNGDYTKSGINNSVKPVFCELNKKVWGIVGLGSIGRRTAEIAKALGCRVIAYKRTPDTEYDCVSIEELCKSSDIISLHLPLTDKTRNLIDEEKIHMMKNNAIVINVARGAIVDEAALCRAVKNGSLGGIAVDVYTKEPLSEDSPYNTVRDLSNVILTPHMAWAAYESRMRCLEEVGMNIDAFFAGVIRNRVDI